MSRERIRLLLHSKDQAGRCALRAALASDYEVLVESDEQEAKRLIRRKRAEVVVLDFDSQESSLEKVLAFIGEVRNVGVPVLVMTDDTTRSTAMGLVERGVYDYFRKPPHLTELKIAVRRAWEHSQLKLELQAARETLNHLTKCDHLIGASEKMQNVFQLIRRVADLDANVVIRGESGTGKELVARAIHNLSHRAQQPFIAISCGAIPETLVESEVFGHERGAFTGATCTKEGYFQRVGEGTLFLDEMAEMSGQTQVKFLRVLQEREFTRVGGKRMFPLKARMLFATHRNLEEMVVDGTFREDLYYRMNVVRIEIPPLRSRKEDIPTLAAGFMKNYATTYQRPVDEIEPSAMQMLLRHDWPGNVRELENVVQRAVILAEGRAIGPQHMPAALRHAGQAEPEWIRSDDSFDLKVRSFKRQLVHQALEECGGNKTLAAARLGITRPYLHRILRHEPAPLRAEHHYESHTEPGIR